MSLPFAQQIHSFFHLCTIVQPWGCFINDLVHFVTPNDVIMWTQESCYCNRYWHNVAEYIILIQNDIECRVVLARKDCYYYTCTLVAFTLLL